MTEKDAVKCRSFGSDTMYYLPVNAVLEDAFWSALWSHQQLKGYY
jgi:tetraacyldisaccharide 4'-kinase